MATIKWPEGLRGPLVSTCTTMEVVGFTESPLASGPSFVEPISDDNPTFYNFTYQMKRGDARRFEIFLRENKFKVYSPWFDGPVIHPDFAAQKTQECRFTASGYPQLTGVTIGGIFTYTAQVIVRQVETQDILYAEETKSAWESNCGDVNVFNNELDLGFNDYP